MGHVMSEQTNDWTSRTPDCAKMTIFQHFNCISNVQASSPQCPTNSRYSRVVTKAAQGRQFPFSGGNQSGSVLTQGNSSFNRGYKPTRELTTIASGSSEYGEDKMLSEPTYATPEPLATPASKAALERIKSAADGLKATFACGGSVECSQPVRIFFWENGGDIQSEVRLSLLDPESAAWLLDGGNLHGST